MTIFAATIPSMWAAVGSPQSMGSLNYQCDAYIRLDILSEAIFCLCNSHDRRQILMVWTGFWGGRRDVVCTAKDNLVCHRRCIIGKKFLSRVKILVRLATNHAPYVC